MGTKPVRFTTAAALLVLAACGADEPTTAPSFAKGPAGQQFVAAPTAVEFSVPPGGSEVITVTVQYLTTVTSSTSNSSCATVSPASVPTKKPKGSSSYVATFTVTAVGVGNCTITLQDKNNKSATVQVTVGAPLPDRIVYSSFANGSSDVYIMDLDGQNKTPLTTTTDQDELGALSADGRKILMFWIKEVAPGSWDAGYKVMNVDGSNQTPIGVTGEISFAELSPNRSQLVFSRSLNSRDRLFKADLSGANEVQLTSPGDQYSDQVPSWAGGVPGRIAFIRETRSVWIMNADGSGQTVVVPDGDSWLHDTFSLALSPDGTRIAFECTPTIHEVDICVVNVDGTGKTQLTTTVGSDQSPRWTRDGRIIFTSRRDGNSEVYIMNADGTDQTNLTNTPGVSESTSTP